jgi:excinuclease UvrABC nuclease subunit
VAARRGVPGDPAADVEGLYLLQRVRDEAHRFAITFHRQRRSKRMTVSAWTVCRPGRDPRKALLRTVRLGEAARAASLEEIAEVPGIGRRTAEAILARAHGLARRQRRPTEVGRPSRRGRPATDRRAPRRRV